MSRLIWVWFVLVPSIVIAPDGVPPELLPTVIEVAATAYSSEVSQCDSTPFITASGDSVGHGVLAVSWDLFICDSIGFGSIVTFDGMPGEFVVKDLMNPRWERRVDLWMSDRSSAVGFGFKRQLQMLVWAKGCQEPSYPEIRRWLAMYLEDNGYL